MIQEHKNAFYLVFPPWAKLPFKWEDLPQIFRNPYKAGFLDQPQRWKRLGYTLGRGSFEFIDGPCGNGIIKGTGTLTKARYLWFAALTKGAAVARPSGVPLEHPPIT